MKAVTFLAGVAVLTGGCSTSTTVSVSELTAQNTTALCHALAASTDEQYRRRVATLLVRRGATAEKCTRLVQTDNAVAGVAAAAGAAAKNGGGGYYVPRPQVYAVAWDRFYGPNYSVIWRCRD